MKLPRFNAEKAFDFALRHGEKIVVGLVGLGALALAWGGIDALRSLSVTEAQTPEALERIATQARGHIDRDAQPPLDLLPPRTPLADSIDPWRTPLVPWKSGSMPWLTIAAPPTLALLDKPLFEEAAKRDKPDVFPVEDLRAVAGLAVVPRVPDGADAPQPAAVLPAKPKPPAGRRPPRGADPLAGGFDPAVGLDPTAAPAAGQQATIVPFVVVTGLIPVAKQQAEYRRRFESCGYRDPKRDSPLWCDFEIDRGTTGPDGQVVWESIDLAAVAARQAENGLAANAVGVPAEFLLTPAEESRSRQTTPIGFCSPLPRRLDGSWELADLHPWVVDRLEQGLVEQARQQQGRPGEQMQPDAGREGPDFLAPEERPPEPAPVPDARPTLPEYRLFRFVDTDVEERTTYRYRVRVKLWNPNYDRMPERMRPHLVDPALALEPKLPAAASEASTAATVPDSTRILVNTLTRDEIKEMRLRPGMLEVFVLAPSKQTGTFTLGGLIAEPGAVMDVDEKFNLRNQRDRARGAETMVTKRILVDARGRQEVRLEGADEKDKTADVIPEPLDVLCLRPDGSFELVTVADSEQWIANYRATLPPRGPKADTRDPAAAAPVRDALPADPLARPGAGR